MSDNANVGMPAVPGVERLELRQVAWEHPDMQRLCEQQQDELRRIYGGSDIEPVLPAAEMVVCLVGYVDGAAVACGALRRRSDTAAAVGELKRMYTAPEFRSRGYGRVILDALMQAARDAGFTRLELETGLRQPHAMTMYEHAGFAPIANFGPYADEPDSRCYGRDL